MSIFMNIKNKLLVLAATRQLIRFSEVSGSSFYLIPFGLSKKDFKVEFRSAIEKAIPMANKLHKELGLNRPCYRVVAAHAALSMCNKRIELGLLSAVDVCLTSELAKEMIYSGVDIKAVEIFMPFFDDVIDEYGDDEQKCILSSMIESKKRYCTNTLVN